MRNGCLFAVGLALLVSICAQAQTAYPYPYPSAYPRTRRNSNTTGVTGAHKDLAGTFHGTLKQLSNKEIVIQNDDDQTVVIRRSKKTKFLLDEKEIKASAIAMNTLVTVEASEDVDLKPIAVSLSIDIPKLDKDQPEAKPKQ
jgi:hypothetical protein